MLWYFTSVFPQFQTCFVDIFTLPPPHLSPLPAPSTQCHNLIVLCYLLPYSNFPNIRLYLRLCGETLGANCWNKWTIQAYQSVYQTKLRKMRPCSHYQQGSWHVNFWGYPVENRFSVYSGKLSVRVKMKVRHKLDYLSLVSVQDMLQWVFFSYTNSKMMFTISPAIKHHSYLKFWI